MTDPVLRRVAAPFADISNAMEEGLRGKLESQLVHGELFVVEEERDGWMGGYSPHDGYVGWVNGRGFSGPVSETPTHFVSAARSHSYALPSLRAPAISAYSFGSYVEIQEEKDGFLRLSHGGWMHETALLPVDQTMNDYLSTAMLFADTPYYWGGRSGFGIDCSGLVQVCLGAAGVQAGRDTEDQIGLGSAAETPAAGDLVFFPGHVAIMLDDRAAINANGEHMKVVIESLESLIERRGAPVAIRRLV